MKSIPLLVLLFLSSQEAKAPDRVERAQKLLADAGFPGGKDFPAIEILYNTQAAHKKVALAVQRMWNDNLGITAKLRNVEWKLYLDDQSALRFQVIRRGWVGDFNDPSTFLELFTTESGNNNTGWSNKQYDALVAAASAESDLAKRFAMLRNAEKILLDEAPVMPIYFYASANFWKARVKGIYSNIRDIHPLTEVFREGLDPLVLQIQGVPKSFDPTEALGVDHQGIVAALFEGLMVSDPRTLEPKPGVAEKVDRSADGLTYTFHLRECQWTDGRAVKAEDFVYAWIRALSPESAAEYAYQLHPIKGAKDFSESKVADSKGVGLRAVDDKTLEVKLERPCPVFLEACTYPIYLPVRKDVVVEHGNRWTEPDKIVGNGAFRLKEWDTKGVTIEKNATYRGAPFVKQPRIRFLPIETPQKAWEEFKADRLDGFSGIPGDEVVDFAKLPEFHSDPVLVTYFYAFNVTDERLKDARVRRALSLAIDREAIVKETLNGGQKPAYHLTPPAWSGYSNPRLDEK